MPSFLQASSRLTQPKRIEMSINIPKTDQCRVVVIGGGFAGLTLIKKLNRHAEFQVVLIDKNNYHQFQPLFYQVAMAGLEPSSIVFPFRKLLQKSNNCYFRMTEVLEVDTAAKVIETGIGGLSYDKLIIATGVDTNYFGNQILEQHVIPMKTVSEALFLRNAILDDYEAALTEPDHDKRQHLLDIVIVGGGPTGVEVAGALAEMKKYVLPKDYKELSEAQIDIYLLQGGPRLLDSMSESASAKAESYLVDLGVKVKKGHYVTSYDGTTVTMNNGETYIAKKVIWAAGISGKKINGIPETCFSKGNRLRINAQHEILGLVDCFAIGDIAIQQSDAMPFGHPQVAQVAIQMASNLANNLVTNQSNPFKYKDLGSMATVGRNAAVVDLKRLKFSGFIAWVMWLFVHLFSILGLKNKIFVFINWVWNYLTYDQSLRLLIRPRKKGE